MKLRLAAVSCLLLASCFVNTEPQPDVTVLRLIILLNSPDHELRRTAALSLGKIASPNAASALINALYDGDPLVRQYGAWALGNLEEHAPSSAIRPLISLLHDPSQVIADTAGQAIGRIGHGPEAIPNLLKAIVGGSAQARRSAIFALAQIESSVSYDELCHALEDNDPGVRQRAVAALGELGDRRAVPAIIERLEHDPATSVRNEAAYRLGLIGEARALPSLKKASVEDPSETVRRWSQQAILALSSPDERESRI